MKKIVVLSLICFLSVQFVSAQRSGSLSGIITDEATGEIIPGAVVELTQKTDTTKKKYESSDTSGRFNMSNVNYGSYRMTVIYLGYENYVRELEINQRTTNLGNVLIKQASRQIDAVKVEAQAIRTSQAGDTLMYNADAFKVTKDSDVEGLLAKMPGLTVIDGKVEAQGEEVKKVFVDGKELFGDNVSTVIRNLPAEVVSQVEVFNKLSDQAEMTGVDDGEGYKAINLVTTIKGPSQYGRAYAGYGFNDKYTAGLNLNYVNGNHRFTIIGGANNINQTDFSGDDILGTQSSSGISMRGGGRMRGGSWAPSGINTTNMFGINYNGEYDKVKLSLNYAFLNMKNENISTRDRQNFLPDGVLIDSTRSNSVSKSYEHRIEGRIDYDINENHRIRFRPYLNFQTYNTSSMSTGSTLESADGLVASLDDLINKSSNTVSSKMNGYDMNANLNYRARLGNPGRSVSVEVGGSLTKNYSNSVDSTRVLTYEEAVEIKDEFTSQNRITDNRGYRLNGSLMYTEPLSANSQLNLQYRVNYRYSDYERKTYLWDAANSIFNPDYDDDLSTVYNNGYITHRVGPGYNYSKNRDVITASVYYQYSTLAGDYELPRNFKREHSFNDIVYFARLRKNFNPTNNLMFTARSSTNNPGISQLEDILDTSNPLSVRIGNPDLKPSYSHFGMLHYNRSSITKGTTFMIGGGVNIISNSIVDSTVRATSSRPVELPNGEMLQEGGSFSKPVNMNGSWSVHSMVGFGLPLKFIKSNLNFNGSVRYTESPSIVNGEENKTKGQYYELGVILGSNISENLDFTISYNGGYSLAKYSVASSQDTEMFTHNASLRFKWITWKGITLTGNANYSRYQGVDDYLMCNLYVGKKVFKNQRGEILFGVNDMFDNSTSYSRTINDQYIQNSYSNTIGRYFNIRFVYTLRNFGQASDESSGMRRGGPGGSGRPPMMMGRPGAFMM